MVLRDHLGFQGMTGNQESLDDQDQQVSFSHRRVGYFHQKSVCLSVCLTLLCCSASQARRVQMGSVALRGLRGLGGTKEKLDQKDFRQTLRSLESLERKV